MEFGVRSLPEKVIRIYKKLVLIDCLLFNLLIDLFTEVRNVGHKNCLYNGKRARISVLF